MDWDFMVKKPPMAKSLIKRRDSYHPNPPIGAEVRMTNLDDNGTAKVRINDRRPYVKDRVIDVSRAAAKKLDMTEDGTA